MRELTKSQNRVLRFIQKFCKERGFPPTHKEIAEGLGFKSANAAGEHLRLLVKKNVILLEPGVSRGIKVIESTGGTGDAGAVGKKSFSGSSRTLARGGPEEFQLPLIGQVAAGQPILAEAHVERMIAVDRGLFRARPDYLLRVRGDSMIDAGIHSGDFVAVSRGAKVKEGQIAVVRLEDEVTVKRWRTKGQGSGLRVVLEPANAALKAMTFDPVRTTVFVEGLVVGLVRPSIAGAAGR